MADTEARLPHATFGVVGKTTLTVERSGGVITVNGASGFVLTLMLEEAMTLATRLIDECRH